MEVFRTFRKLKCLLRAAAFAIFLANLQGAWAERTIGLAFTWTGAGTDSNWTTPENWDNNDGYPGENQNDTAVFSGVNEASVVLDTEITLAEIILNQSASNKNTIDLNGHNITCSWRILLVAETEHRADANVVLTGSGQVTCDTFDFPSNGEHLFNIKDETTKLIIAQTLWANSSGRLTFSGNGYLYMPNGGGNVNYGASNIQYTIPAEHRLPCEGDFSTYKCETSLASEDTPDGATIKFSKGLENEGSSTIQFPFKVIITGASAVYKLNTTPETTLSNGVYTGRTPAAYGTSEIKLPGINSKTYTLSCTLSTGTSFNKGDGITIIFYSPDGQLPSDSTETGTKSFMEIGRLSWYYQSPVWTGKGKEKGTGAGWTNKDNWTGITGVDLTDLSNYDIEISTPASSTTSFTPVIDEDVQVKSLTITGGSKLEHKKGKLSINKITTSGTGKFIGKDTQDPLFEGGLVELIKYGTDAPSLEPAFANSIVIDKLSIGEGSSFTMPFDMSLGMLTISSAASFSKNGHTLNLGWLQVQTTNYRRKTEGSDKNIRLTEAFEADSIIILLRDGDITIEKTLTARKDFIIGGAKYNSSKLKYDSFTKRPSSWVPSYTYTSLDIPEENPCNDGSENHTYGSTFYLDPGANIVAGSSSQGNLYINGATIIGTTGNNKIIIPRNDSAKNFCADAVNSIIIKMNVVCAGDSTTDSAHLEDGTYVQVPEQDCEIYECTNFDRTEFKILSAETVSDNRIKVTLSSPARNTQGELNYSSALNSIKVSDGKSFTAIYNEKNGTTTPSSTPTVFYLYTDNTSWNTDATGTSIGSGKYTNSKNVYRTVKPYLVVPQYASANGEVTCGFVLTDKWGKRMKSYFPDSSAFTGVTDGIPEDEKKLRTGPTFDCAIGAVGSDELFLTFSKAIISDSSKICLRTETGSDEDEGTQIAISQSMEELLPSCFQIISISDDGTASKAEDLQVDTSRTAIISQSESESKLGIIKLYLSRPLTLPDIKNLYIRLIQHPDYTGTFKDPVTHKDGTKVTFIQESDVEHKLKGSNFMIENTAHSISDFAIGAVSPKYAYNSETSEGGEELSEIFKNIYGEGSFAARDFSKNQKNYGTLTYGQEITLVSKGIDGTSDNSSLPSDLILYVSDTPDANSLFTKFNREFGTSVSIWLPNIPESLKEEFSSYTECENTRFWDFSSTLINKGKPSDGYTFTIQKDTVLKMQSGSQLTFLYALCDSAGNLFERIRAPHLSDAYKGTYDLSQATRAPLFVFRLSNPQDLLSLDLWYLTLKSITEQRGGVTILNNVINASLGEKTVLKVNMPSSGNLDVMIMTIDGNIVKYLAHGNASAGEHFYYWDGHNNAGSEVARGMYFVIIKAPGIDENRKVMVVK